MNMKKSIAGIMAGAMAVSAMATTASAWTGGGDQETILLSYDLKLEKEAWSDTKITLTYTLEDRNEGYRVQALDAKTDVAWTTLGAKLTGYADAGMYYNLDSIAFRGVGISQKDANGKDYTPTVAKTIVSSDSAKEDMEKINTNDYIMCRTVEDDVTGNVYAFRVPFTTTDKEYVADLDNPLKKVDAINVRAFGIGGEDTTVFGGATITVTEHKPTESDYTTTFVDNADVPATPADPDAPATPVEANEKKVYFAPNDDAFTIAQHAEKEQGIIEDKENLTDAEKKTKKKGEKVGVGNFKYDATEKLTDDNGTYILLTWQDEVIDVEYSAIGGTPVVNVFKEEYAATPEGQAKYEYDLPRYQGVINSEDVTYGKATGKVVSVVPEENKITVTGAASAYGFRNYSVTLNYTANAQKSDGSGNIENKLYLDEGNIKNAFVGIDGIADKKPTKNIAKGSSTKHPMPMKSSPTKPANVIERLEKKGYTWPLAVLNDVIANNEAVTFTFETSQLYVDNREWVKASRVKGNYATIDNPSGGKTTMKFESNEMVTSNGSTFVKNPFQGVGYTANKKNDWTNTDNALWHNPYFSQDLYQKWTWNGDHGYNIWGPNGSQGDKDRFGSYASAWNTNLLMAGLVVNSNWTMQLNQTTGLEWGDSKITFFWDTLTGEDRVTNFTDVITSMQLVTPTEWYWDSLEVGVGASAVQDANTAEGLEEDAEEVVEEEVTEEEVIEEELIEEETEELEEEEIFEEETEETEEELPEETEAPAEEESPKTGNAPVALAVIPVALAAAAVIAKKKN